MKSYLHTAVVLLATFALVACTSTARLYNLRTGAVIRLHYVNNGLGHGEITGTMPNGTKLKGEYSTMSGIRVTGYSASLAGFSWARAQGFSFTQPAAQYGTATLAGPGEVIQAIYEVDPWSGNGHGVARDNHGNIYSLEF